MPRIIASFLPSLSFSTEAVTRAWVYGGWKSYILKQPFGRLRMGKHQRKGFGEVGGDGQSCWQRPCGLTSPSGSPLLLASWIQFGRGRRVFSSEECPEGGAQAALLSAWDLGWNEAYRHSSVWTQMTHKGVSVEEMNECPGTSTRVATPLEGRPSSCAGWRNLFLVFEKGIKYWSVCTQMTSRVKGILKTVLSGSDSVESE